MDQDQLLMSMLAAGLSHCTIVLERDGTLLGSLFVAGLLGSLSHCIGMCGPFVLSQTAARLETISLAKMSEFRRLCGAALIPYHLGRMTTYCAIGVAGSYLAKGLLSFKAMAPLSAILLGLAAVFFLVYGLKKLGVRLPRLRPSQGRAAGSSALGKWLNPFFARPLGWRGYVLGLGLGFLPCGLLYGAVAAAAAGGDGLSALIAMIAFTLGTVPSLFGVALLGHMAGQRWKGLVDQAAPVLLIVNAGVLAYLALRLGMDGAAL